MLPEVFPIVGGALRKWLATAGQDILLSSASGADALRFIRSAGMAIRTSDFYSIYNDVINMQANITELGSMPEDQLIPMGLTEAPANWDLSTGYLYRFQVTGVDPKTGDPTSKFFAVGSDRQLTPGEAAEALNNLIEGEEEFYQIADMEYKLNGAFCRPEIKNRF